MANQKNKLHEYNAYHIYIHKVFWITVLILLMVNDAPPMPPPMPYAHETCECMR